MQTEKTLPGWYRKTDKIIVTAAKYLSFIGAAALIIIALITTVDAFATKVFRLPLQNVTDLVTYMNIPCVFTCIAYVQLTNGHTHIDLFYKKLPKAAHKVIHIFGYLVGIAVCGFAGVRGFALMLQKLESHVYASTTTSFLIWPFILFIGLGYSMLAIAFAWSIVREFYHHGPYEAAPAEEQPEAEKGEAA